jgi:diguanylate cyclase (GGDEF)-like protein/PAS domain S-box-containing protein
MTTQDLKRREALTAQARALGVSTILPAGQVSLPGKLDPGILGFIVDTACEAVYIFDEQRHIIYANGMAAELSGYSEDELLGMHLKQIDPAYPIVAPALASKRATHGERARFESAHRTKSGVMLPVEVSIVSTVFGGCIYHSSFVRDISSRKALREGELRFRVIADTSPVALLLCDHNGGRIHYANHQAARMLHLSIPSMLNHSFLEVLQAGGAKADLLTKLDAGEELQNQELLLHYNDAPVWVSLSTSNLVLEGERVQCNALMDVTEAHELSNQLIYQATYDDLTGLVNRREFEDRLQEVIELTQQRRSENVLCYLDLDQFKVINDTCGHMAGDELLRQLAQELYRCVRRDDTLARLGGDEFAILLENCSIDNAERAANNVRNAVQNFRFLWNENMFTVGVSIGLTLIAKDGESLSEVLRRADAACYAAKEAGRNRLHIFRPDDKDLAQRHTEMSWVARINAALEDNRLELWHQEIAQISREDETQGHTAEDHFEVLVRMRDTDGSLIMPGSFLPAVERYALAAKIDRWVLRALFKWLEDNPANSDRIGICAINLSGQTLGDLNFHDEVIALIESSKLRADCICFEITETSAIANLSNATLFMQRLKQHGCTFALDDFGSGLSSFAYLKTLPVDFVKIDGLFVKDILSDPVDRAMVKAIIEMAHALGKYAIAEFVENDAILQELIDLGVDYVQGYGIGRPAPLR